MNELGMAVRFFFEDHLKVQKGLRPSSISSYRDVLKLFLKQIAERHRCSITRLKLTDLVADEVLVFLHNLEAQRGNQVRTRNQRLVALRTFFRYLASRAPETLAEAQRVEAIPTKRCVPPQTYYLERDEVDQLLAKIPTTASGLRDRAILIRAWLGHVCLETTNRYAEINFRAKEAAVALCTPSDQSSVALPQERAWHRDIDLLKWLESL